MEVFKHVLVATDFSEASSGAVDLAVALAHGMGADLTVVHTCEVPPYTEMPLFDLITPIVELQRSKLEERMVSIRKICPAAKAVVNVGAAWEQILAAAAEARADVIVVGTHGRRGVAHAVIGSVAERVVRHSPIPVLTVRSRPPG